MLSSISSSSTRTDAGLIRPSLVQTTSAAVAIACMLDDIIMRVGIPGGATDDHSALSAR